MSGIGIYELLIIGIILLFNISIPLITLVLVFLIYDKVKRISERLG